MVKREAVFAVLREKSTLAGIAGLVVVLAGVMGHDLDQTLVSEIMLALISIIAIATRPQHGNHRGDNRNDSHDLRT
jgi:hypothetical protein